MAVAFQNVNGKAFTNSSTTGAVPMPSGVSAGDLLISECWLTNGELTLAVSGWTIILQGVLSGQGQTYGIAYRIATGGAEAPVWTWDGNNHINGANVWRFTGAYNAAPIGASALVQANGTTVGTSALNATAAGSYFASFNSTLGTNQTVPVPSGYTSRNNFSSAASSERMSSKNTTNVGDSSGASTVTITTSKNTGVLLELRSSAPPNKPFRAQLVR